MHTYTVGKLNKIPESLAVEHANSPKLSPNTTHRLEVIMQIVCFVIGIYYAASYVASLMSSGSPSVLPYNEVVTRIQPIVLAEKKQHEDQQKLLKVLKKLRDPSPNDFGLGENFQKGKFVCNVSNKQLKIIFKAGIGRIRSTLHQERARCQEKIESKKPGKSDVALQQTVEDEAYFQEYLQALESVRSAEDLRRFCAQQLSSKKVASMVEHALEQKRLSAYSLPSDHVKEGKKRG